MREIIRTGLIAIGAVAIAKAAARRVPGLDALGKVL